MMKKIDYNRLRRVSIIIICISLCGIAYYEIIKHTGFSVKCASHELTGLYCFGCGTTRMVCSIAKLDFYQAFRYNQLVFVLLPGGIFLIIKSIIEYIHGVDYRQCSMSLFLKKNIVVILIVVLVWSVVRNVFTVLQPLHIN